MPSPQVTLHGDHSVSLMKLQKKIGAKKYLRKIQRKYENEKWLMT